MIKVSIITVCFNSEKTIRRTIESVLNQTYKNIEYIVIDGASTDNTLGIIEDYKGRFGEKLTVVSEKDEGMYYAINKGINISSGDIVGIINSDDWYEPEAIDMIVKAYERQVSKYGVFYGMVRFYKDENWTDIGMKSHTQIREDMIAHPACFVTKLTYDDISLYGTKYKYVSDYELMLKLCNDERVEFYPVFGLIANMQLGGASASGKAWLERVELQHEWKIMSDKEYKKIMLKERIMKLIK